MRKIALLLFLILITTPLKVSVTAQSQSMYMDTDGDGLTDRDEINVYNTHPALFDTDGDGLGDGTEIKLGTDPNDDDTDGDGLTDGEEIKFSTSPLLKDTDRDGLSDKFELIELPKIYHLPPSDPTNPDTDGDGLSDKFEWEYRIKGHMERYLNPDEDGDGIKDGDEIYTMIEGNSITEYHCDLTTDCDGDFIPDSEELKLGTLPYSRDTDWDGLPDNLELKFGSSPFRRDTDGDGLTDFQEVLPKLIYEFKLTENITSILGRELPSDEEYTWWESFVSDYLNTTDVCVPTVEDLKSYVKLNKYPFSIVERYIHTGMHSYLNPVFTSDYKERYMKNEVHIDNAICYFGIPTDPTKYDTDGDGLSDYEELHYTVEIGYCPASFPDNRRPLLLDPNDPDSDGDGIIDSVDLVPVEDDIDGDKLIEQDTCAYFTDCDGDGLIDYKEYILKTDPKNPDTDGDGLTDYTEVSTTWTVNGKTSHTDPLNPDTDGDGFTDYQEYKAGTVPTDPTRHPQTPSTVQKPKYNKTKELKAPPRYGGKKIYNITVTVNGKKVKPGYSTLVIDTDTVTIEIKVAPLKIVKDNGTVEEPVQKIGFWSSETGYSEVQGNTLTKTFVLENFSRIGIAFEEVSVTAYYTNSMKTLNYGITFKYKTLPEVKLEESNWDNNLDVGKLVFECRFCKNVTIIVPGALVNGKKKRVIELGRTIPLKYIYARIIPHRYTVASESDVGTIYTKYENSVEVLKTGKDIGLLTAKAIEAKSFGSKIIYGMVATAKGIKTIIGGVETFIPEEENAEIEKPEGVDTPTSAKFDKEAFKKGVLNMIKEKLIDATFDYVTEKAVEYADAKELEARRHKTTYHVTVKACNDFGCKTYGFTVEGYAYEFE